MAFASPPFRSFHRAERLASDIKAVKTPRMAHVWHLNYLKLFCLTGEAWSMQ